MDFQRSCQHVSACESQMLTTQLDLGGVFLEDRRPFKARCKGTPFILRPVFRRDLDPLNLSWYLESLNTTNGNPDQGTLLGVRDTCRFSRPPPKRDQSTTDPPSQPANGYQTMHPLSNPSASACLTYIQNLTSNWIPKYRIYIMGFGASCTRG